MTYQFGRLLADPVKLREALSEADIQPMLLTLVHLSEADAHFLDEVRPHIHGPWNFMQSVPPELVARIRERLVTVLQDYAQSGRPIPGIPAQPLLKQMMEACVGQTVADEYVPLIVEETGLDESSPRSVAWRRKPPASSIAEHDVVIVGAGMSGICMAIKLKEAGIPFIVIEKNDAVGGTWLENVYPGCAVDVPNHFFSFSFELNPDWPRHFSQGEELRRYLEHCVDKYDLRPHIRLGAEVTAADYDEAGARWALRIVDKDGVEEVLHRKYLMMAVGQLNRPSVPAIPGLGDFAGAAMHTARWDPATEVVGKRVAMIGTGASGMQVAPTIAGEVEKLTIFQRSPHWAMNNPNYHLAVKPGMRWALKHIPLYAKWYRFCLFWAASDGMHVSLQRDPDWASGGLSLNAENHRFREQLIAYIEQQVDGDPELMRKVIPDYPPYGKRMLRDNNWYQMLKRPNVDLVVDDIDHVERDCIVSKTGERYPTDIIVLATGFDAGRMLWPVEIKGRHAVSLRSLWGDDDPRAYLGITLPHFPNFFMLYGPNTNLAHGGSIIFHTECQVRYIVQVLREMIEGSHQAVECRQDVHDHYNERIDRAHEKMVWTHSGVGNWYKNKKGRVFATSPWRLVDYWTMTQTFVPSEYEIS